MYYSFDAVRHGLGAVGWQNNDPEEKSMCEVCLVKTCQILFTFFHCRTNGFNERCVCFPSVRSCTFPSVSSSFNIASFCGILGDFFTQIRKSNRWFWFVFSWILRCKTFDYVGHDSRLTTNKNYKKRLAGLSWSGPVSCLIVCFLLPLCFFHCTIYDSDNNATSNPNFPKQKKGQTARCRKS